MTFNEAQAEFAVRYYRWAREEFRSEIEHGFPLLKKLNTHSSKVCLHLMAQLTPDNQLRFAAALVKRFRKPVLEITGETLSEWETATIKRYTDSSVVIPFPNEDRVQSDGSPPKLNRKNLARAVKSYLAPVLKQEPEKVGGGAWRYANRVGDLQLYTHLDFGGRFSLCYAHDIVFSGYNRLVEFASVESWLGLSGQTAWFYLDDSDLERMAQLIAELCERFLNAAPGLVEGISP